MLSTSHLLTAFMLGGWLAVTPAAMAAKGNYNYTFYRGVIQGNAQMGDVRMSGTVPVARNLRTYNGRRWNSQTHYQVRVGRNSAAYANLNQ